MHLRRVVTAAPSGNPSMANEHLPLAALESVAEKSRILLIDDDRKFARLLAIYLAPNGYDIVAVHDGLSGIKQASEGSWQLVMLDVMLPGLDGFEVLKRLRMISAMPIMMVTARSEESDRIVGLELGADDYVPKTFSSRELLARIRALLRRTSGELMAVANEPKSVIVTGILKIDQSAHRVFVEEREVLLTPIEFNLLVGLALAKGRPRSRELMLREIRDRKFQTQDRSIDMHISTLRRKLGETSVTGAGLIRTVRGIGYMLMDSNDQST